MSSKEGEDRKNPVTESNISDEVSLQHPELNTKETQTNTMSCCTETEENRENPLIESNISDEFSLQHPALNTKETQKNTMSSKGETGENRENPVAESNISSELSLQHPELNTTRTQKNATSSKEETGENGEKPAIESDASDEVSLQLPDLKSKNSEEGTETNRENPKVEPENKIDNSDQISPRGVLDIPISGGLDSDSSSSSSNNSSKISQKSIAPDGSVLEPQTMQWRNLITGLLLKRNRSMRKLLTFPPAKKSLEISRSSLQRNLRRIQNAEDQMEHRVETIFVHQRPTWRSFDLQELVVATDNFSSENLIGKGGHAEVYKGCLHDGQVVAVKRLTKRNTEEERIRDFLSELGMIAHVNHPNAAQLLGFGVEGGLHLVLQFSPHGSLASVLHGSDEGLQWGIRFKIARGIAEGLLYLHEGCQRRIIHRDIKASNILLTQDYEPQISDFGLAKWLPDKWTHHIVFPIEGTFGYLAPEYFMHGIVNEKTDVFAFGVLLLELITGRRAVDSCRKSLVIWAKPLLEEKNMEELIDPSLRDAYDPTEMGLAVLAASICIHHLSTMRPTMNWVVRLLRGEDASLDLMAREPKIVVRRPPVFDACDTEDYTCSRYLNDLNRYKQLAMEQ